MTTNPDDANPAQRGGLLRFTVDCGSARVTAFMSEQVSRVHFGAEPGGSLVELYRANQPVIDDAVVRKARSGVRQPVVLRAQDLQARCAGGRSRGSSS